MKDKRVVFMGTPEFSVPVLRELIAKTNVVLVVSQPDAYVGRKKILTPSPVKSLALENNIPVLTPEKLKNDYENILNYKPDIIITCAYGKIVPKVIRDYPEYGCINVHASLLPKYRGASPIHRVIRDGEEKTGITIMYMDQAIDTGNIIQAEEIKIEKNDTLGTLEKKLSELGKKVLIKTLPSIFNNTNFSLPQDDYESSYAGLINRDDERLSFQMKREEVYNHIRSLNPAPLANFILSGEEIKVIESRVGQEKNGEIGVISSVGKDYFAIMCQDGEIEITKIKPAGKKEMMVKDYFNGCKKETLLGLKVGDELV